MYKIKQLPEDFIVREISDLKFEDKCRYAYFILKKTNYTTMHALEIIADKLKIPLKNIGFAGNKDKNAVTEQKISILNGTKKFENLEPNNIKLEYLGKGNNPLSLGDLTGNEFEITIRNLENNEISKIKNCEDKKLEIPNLFGPQRFSNNNHLIGKAVIKRDFRKAIELIVENKGKAEEQIRYHLSNSKNDFIGAFRLIPYKTRKIFVHSYQSSLFNEIVSQYLESKSKVKINTKIPIIGFDFDISSLKPGRLKNIIKEIIFEEKISPRDFIISQMPELSSEGTERELFFELNDLKVLEIADDELNPGKKKARINFSLPKSCYATVALEHLLQ